MQRPTTAELKSPKTMGPNPRLRRFVLAEAERQRRGAGIAHNERSLRILCCASAHLLSPYNPSHSPFVYVSNEPDIVAFAPRFGSSFGSDGLRRRPGRRLLSHCLPLRREEVQALHTRLLRQVSKPALSPVWFT